MLPLWAGQGAFDMSPACWTCQGSSCSLQGDFAELGPTNSSSTSSVSAFVGVPSGGVYILSYSLINGAGPPNSWRAIISYDDGSSDSYDILRNFPEAINPLFRSVTINLPDGTSVVNLTFAGSQVRQCYLNRARFPSLQLDTGPLLKDHTFRSKGTLCQFLSKVLLQNKECAKV